MSSISSSKDVPNLKEKSRNIPSQSISEIILKIK